MTNKTDEHEYLTFTLNGEEYGVDILCVQEIRVWNGVTELPHKPAYVKGVINLRGVIIPIIDLRLRFSMKPLAYNEQTVIIILRSNNKENAMVVGIVVDAVSDVYKFSSEQIKAAPDFGRQIDRCFLKGLASTEDKLIIMLDMQSLLNQEDLYKVEQQVIDELTEELQEASAE
jgi:purine-binding chemotaxis protein CheW